MRKRVFLSTLIILLLVCYPKYTAGEETSTPQKDNTAAETPTTLAEIEAWWKAGKTLPLETTAKYPLHELWIRNDTGINVLVDMAHKCDFFTLWNLGRQLNARGLRTVGSHATLESVLPPDSLCRVRIPVAPKVLPFAWWKPPRFNVVLTQGGTGDPGYTVQERKTLKEFVNGGGGLIVTGSWVRDAKTAKEWSLNKMLGEYGASVEPGVTTEKKRRWPALKVSDDWEILRKGDNNRPLVARRTLGKGRIVLLASNGLYYFDRKKKEDVADKCDFLTEMIKWAAAGSPPVGGEKRLPQPMGGGGGIYPESETTLNGMVCFYSKNQIPELLATVKNDFPAITKDLYAWIPSPRPVEPMYMILCSGGGGGWAVNAYLPKEASTISTSADGIRSIFGHEQAHTMSGPCKAANHPFGGNQGEEHAGWYQGKINAKYNGVKGPNRGCNGVFLQGYQAGRKTPKEIFKKERLEKWEQGHDRLMIWYVWQKLDDRYGPTWYPRWRWVQGQRWKNEPGKKLTWEESIEDMSIAVGEDLFPFFAKTGKKLTRSRLEKADFMGKQIKLPIAPIEPTPAGDVQLVPIKDYTKPITPNNEPNKKSP